MGTSIRERVEALEEVLRKFIVETNKAFLGLDERIERMCQETSEIFDRLSEKIEEVNRRTNESINRMREEMERSRKETEKELRKLSREVGNVAGGLGRLVEDIVLPSIPNAIKKSFGIEVSDVMARRKVRKNDKTNEYDVLAVSQSTKPCLWWR